MDKDNRCGQSVARHSIFSYLEAQAKEGYPKYIWMCMRRRCNQNIFGGACEESVIQMYLEGHEESKIENFLSTEAYLFKVLQVNNGTFLQNTLKH